MNSAPTWNELSFGRRVLRWGSSVVCRKPRLQAAVPTLKRAIRMPGFVRAFRMLGFTAFSSTSTGGRGVSGRTK